MNTNQIIKKSDILIDYKLNNNKSDYIYVIHIKERKLMNMYHLIPLLDNEYTK